MKFPISFGTINLKDPIAPGLILEFEIIPEFLNTCDEPEIYEVKVSISP